MNRACREASTTRKHYHKHNRQDNHGIYPNNCSQEQMSGSCRAIVTNSPLKAQTPLQNTHTCFTHTRSLSATSAVVPHVSCTQPPPPSNSILRGDIPTGAPIGAAPTYSTVCGERATIPDDTLNIRFPIMLLRAPSRFLHHAATSKKQHVALRNT